MLRLHSRRIKSGRKSLCLKRKTVGNVFPAMPGVKRKYPAKQSFQSVKKL
jgi:hypothetical protein